MSMFGLDVAERTARRRPGSDSRTRSAIGVNRRIREVAATIDDDGRVHAGEEIDEIGVGMTELLVAGVELLVDGIQLLVGGLQFFLGGIELFVRGLQLLVAREDFLVRRLQFFVGGLEILNDRLQYSRLELELLLQAQQARIVGIFVFARAAVVLRAFFASACASAGSSNRTRKNAPVVGSTNGMHLQVGLDRRVFRLLPPEAFRAARALAVAAPLKALRSAWSSPSRAIFNRLRLASPDASSRNGPVRPRVCRICSSLSTTTPRRTLAAEEQPCDFGLHIARPVGRAPPRRGSRCVVRRRSRILGGETAVARGPRVSCRACGACRLGEQLHLVPTDSAPPSMRNPAGFSA